MNQAHPSQVRRQCIRCPHRSTKLMLIIAEHQRGQCKLRRQLVPDSLRRLLFNNLQKIPILLEQSRVRHTQVLVKLAILQASLLCESDSCR